MSFQLNLSFIYLSWANVDQFLSKILMTWGFLSYMAYLGNFETYLSSLCLFWPNCVKINLNPRLLSLDGFILSKITMSFILKLSKTGLIGSILAKSGLSLY